MDVSHLLESCLWCGDSYSRSSRPHWAFAFDLTPLGTVHASERARWLKYSDLPERLCRSPEHPEYSRRLAWVDALPVQPSFHEFVLFELPGERERHIKYWREQRPDLWTDYALLQLDRNVLALESRYKLSFPEPLVVPGWKVPDRLEELGKPW